MNTAVENVSISEISFHGDFDQVRAILTVGDTDYECLEYVDDAIVNNTADSHMRVNGIYNLRSKRNEPFIERGMDREDYIRWSAIEDFVRSELQAFVDSNGDNAA